MTVRLLDDHMPRTSKPLPPSHPYDDSRALEHAHHNYKSSRHTSSWSAHGRHRVLHSDCFTNPPNPDAKYSRSTFSILEARARPLGPVLARFQSLPTSGWGDSRRSAKRACHQVLRIPVATLKSDRTCERVVFSGETIMKRFSLTRPPDGLPPQGVLFGTRKSVPWVVRVDNSQPFSHWASAKNLSE